MTILLAGGLFLGIGSEVAASNRLENDRILARFDDRGLVSLHDKHLKQSMEIASDDWMFSIENSRVHSSKLEPRRSTQKGSRRSYVFGAEHFEIEVIYELKPGWRFITKQLQITNHKRDVYTVKHVDVWQGRLMQVPRPSIRKVMNTHGCRKRSVWQG